MTTTKGLDPIRPHRFSRTSEAWRFLAVSVLLGGVSIGSATSQSPQTLHQTSQAELIQANAALSEFAATYEPRLTDAQVVLFRQAQKAWDAFRQADCAFKASGVESGSAYPAVVADCLTRAAEAHLTELQTLSQCEEGDLACPAFKSE